MIDQLWLVPLGFAAGILGSMIGLGGGIIIVPVLTFVGFPPSLAASNSLFATLSNSIASTISYSRQNRVEFKLGIKLGLLSIPGTILGAIISSDASPEVFKILFGMVLVASAIYIFLRKKIKEKDADTSKSIIVFATGASFFAGLISAFFGIGGGVIFVPLMILYMSMTMKKAAPTSQFILFFVSLSGVITHSFLGHPDYAQAGLLAIGAFFGGFVGARLTLKLEEAFLKILISIVMIGAAVKLFIDGLEFFNPV